MTDDRVVRAQEIHNHLEGWRAVPAIAKALPEITASPRDVTQAGL